MALIDKLPMLSKMPRSVKEYAQYKSVIENCSIKTVEEYALDLRTFFRYIVASRHGIPLDSQDFYQLDLSGVDIEFIKTISTEEIYEFLMYTGNERENKASAKSRKLSALKSYYKYMTVKVHKLELNPVINVESPRKKKSLPKHLNIDECKDLLNAIISDTNNKHLKRDYAIVTLFLNSGMRLSELVGIDISHIDSKLRSVKVLGKGSKERIIYLNDSSRSAIEDYLEIRQSYEGSISCPALFLSSRCQRISPKTVQHIVYKYLNAAGLGYKGFSTHKLRHTAATLMYQSGNVDVRVLKDILGHEQLNTTQIYTHISDENMENAMRQNPLSDFTIKKSKKE